MWFTCHGCGAAVDPATAPPFRCPGAGLADDGIDHVLQPDGAAAPLGEGSSTDPFVRYRARLSPYRMLRGAGLPDQLWLDLTGQLGDALRTVEGHGFAVTPLALQPALARAAGHGGPLWLKDETGQVSGSHKSRHLALVMLYLRALEAAGLPAGAGLRERRLAIASCGNAALAAAVVARAADWPLDVFVPPDAEAAVVARLQALGARRTVCERRTGEAGDPCYLRFREAVAGGAIPFGVQGPDNGLAIEGGRTLAYELVEAWRAGGAPSALYVQVGGGALASAVAQGLAEAVAAGVLQRAPRLMAVQTEGCAPLARAWRALGPAPLAAAAQSRRRYMWPWEAVPHSLAHGILDDETYDWWAITEGMRATGGAPVVVGEAEVSRARDLAREHARSIAGGAASATGTAGLAGLLAAPAPGESAAVLFTGAER